MSDLNKAVRQPDTEIPDRETILRRWDTWQKRIAADKDVSWARHEFELLLDGYEEEIGRLRVGLDEARRIIWTVALKGAFPSEVYDAGYTFLSKHQRAE